MKTILIIGIGAGDPEYMTIQAVNALNRVDVFFMLDKGASKQKLISLRHEICRLYIKGRDYRFVDAASPEWERATQDYRATIDGLNQDKQALFERLIADGMADGECGASSCGATLRSTTARSAWSRRSRRAVRKTLNTR